MFAVSHLQKALTGVMILVFPATWSSSVDAQDTTLQGLRSTNEYAPARTRPPLSPHRGGHLLRRSGMHGGSSFLPGAPDRGDAGAGADDAGDGNTPFGNFWWIGATSTKTSGIPNSGVQATIEVIQEPPGVAGGCLSYWTSDVLDNLIWGQVGYSLCDIPNYPEYKRTAFFQVWDLSVGPEGEMLVDSETTELSLGLHNFSMYLQSGTTWAYAVDGNVFGTYDMKATTATKPNAIDTLCEEGDGVVAAFAPPKVKVPIAMEVLNNGVWESASSAISYNSAGLSGVVGQAQDTNLTNDQLIIGGNEPTLPDNTVLWSGTSLDGGVRGTSGLSRGNVARAARSSTQWACRCSGRATSPTSIRSNALGPARPGR